MKTAIISSSISNGANLQSLYLSTRNWLSYIEFFEDELKCFKKMLLKHFLFEADDQGSSRIYEINADIKRLDRQKNQVLNDIFCHQSNLKSTLENMMQLSENYLSLQHTKIEEEVKELQKMLDSMKRSLYRLHQS